MNANVMEPTVTEVLRKALKEKNEPLLVVATDAETIEAFVEVIDDGTPPVRLLAEREILKAVMDDFLTAGRAADHIEAGQLEIRTTDHGTNTLLISESGVAALIHPGSRAAGLTTDDETFTRSTREHFSSVWNDATEYTLRTPPITQVRETLEADLGTATAEDFDSALGSLETTRSGASKLDEVMLLLLVAAKNEKLLYDISKWGEDIGITSKATFSRTKTELEEVGLIDTEKVPIDVGRPRLRLKLAEDRLRNADSDELVEVARSMLDG